MPPIRTAGQACACGGGCPRCAADAAPSTPSSQYEHEARTLAGAISRGAAGSPMAGAPVAPARRSLPPGLPSTVRAAATSTGEALDEDLRARLEDRLGARLGGVRVHTGPTAAESARALHARAYTVGADIVFGAGEYRPDIAAGRALIAHEVVHTVQQARLGASMIQREPNPGSPEEEAESSPPPLLPLPGGLSLLPGPARLYDLEGVKLVLPASARLTNALGTGPGPSFVLDIVPERLVLSLLDRIDLSVSPTPGAAPSAAGDPAQQARVSLLRPIIRLDPSSRRLTGTATLRVPSGYPLSLRDPTDLDVRIESSELGRFSGRIGLGPLHADMTLRLHYDTGRIENAVRPAFAPAGGFAGFTSRMVDILRELAPGIQLGGLSGRLAAVARAAAGGRLPPAAFASRVIALVAESLPAGVRVDDLRKALEALAVEITRPGFSLSGRLGLDLPLLGTLPLSTFSAEAPTTVPLQRPLLGAPTAFPLTYSAGGVIVAPPGAITDISVPALGYTRSSFGAESGTAFTAAALPTLSPAAISAGASFNEQFPVYVFAELSHVRRVSDTVDVGIRLTAQFSTPDLTGRTAAAGGDVNARIQEGVRQFQEAARSGAKDTPPVPNLGLSVFGRF